MIAESNHPLTYMITSGLASDDDIASSRQVFLDPIRRAIDAGVTYVQIREKRLSARSLFELTCDAVKLAVSTETKVLVNDRADIALAARADGVHLTSGSMRIQAVRQLVGDRYIIGRSTHDKQEVLEARNDGADFVVFGPVFATPGKREETGLAVLKDVCAAANRFPVIALGGIDDQNCSSAILAGAAGVAGIRVFGNDESLNAMMNELR